MATNEFTFSPSSILKPAQPSNLNRTAPVRLGPSLTLAAGQAIGRKTTDGKLVRFKNVSASWIPGLTKRFENELRDALKALEAEE